MSSLIESTKINIQDRQKWLAQAKEGERRVQQLPVEVQNLPGAADTNWEGILELSTYGGENMQILANHGAVFQTPSLSTYNGSFVARGILGDKCTITVYSLGVPPGCRVVTEEYTAIRYKAECIE